MSHLIGRGRYARETYPQAVSAVPTDLPLLLAILENNVQHVGPVSTPATLVYLDSPAFTLQPSPVPGSATVAVRASMSVGGTASDTVVFNLIRDRGTVNAQVLAVQLTQLGATDPKAATATLTFLDTAVGTFPAGFIPITEGSTHTYSIEALAANALTGAEPALIELEQLPGGISTTEPGGGPGVVVDMLSLLNFAAFAGTGISTTPGTANTTVNGNIGLGPGVTSTAFTGFGQTVTFFGDHATSALVNPSAEPTVPPLPPGTQGGFLYALDYAPPTPANVNTAYNDMLTAYTDASSRAVSGANTDILGGVIPVHTFVPGVYKWNSNVGFNGDVTLNGAGVYIFIITGTFDLAAATSIILAGGATAENVFFAIAGATTLHANSVAAGQFLTKTNIAMQDGATLTGGAFPQTSLTLIGNTIIAE
jgi:hypothetical protein